MDDLDRYEDLEEEEEFPEDCCETIDDFLTDDDIIDDIIEAKKHDLSAKDCDGNPMFEDTKVYVISIDNSVGYTITDTMREMFESGDVFTISKINHADMVACNGWSWHPKDMRVATKPKNYKKPKPVNFDVSTLDI